MENQQNIPTTLDEFLKETSNLMLSDNEEFLNYDFIEENINEIFSLTSVSINEQNRLQFLLLGLGSAGRKSLIRELNSYFNYLCTEEKLEEVSDSDFLDYLIINTEEAVMIELIQKICRVKVKSQ